MAENTTMQEGQPTPPQEGGVTRRGFLKNAGIAGGALAIPVGLGAATIAIEESRLKEIAKSQELVSKEDQEVVSGRIRTTLDGLLNEPYTLPQQSAHVDMAYGSSSHPNFSTLKDGTNAFSVNFGESVKTPPNRIYYARVGADFGPYNEGSESSPEAVIHYYPAEKVKAKSFFDETRSPQELKLGKITHLGSTLSVKVDENMLPAALIPGISDSVREPSLPELGQVVDTELIPARKQLMEDTRALMEKIVKMPEGVKFLPSLDFNYIQLYGRFPDSSIFYSAVNLRDFASSGFNTLNITVTHDSPDSRSAQRATPGGFETEARRLIKDMDIINNRRTQKGLPPLLSTEYLNQVRQELGL